MEIINILTFIGGSMLSIISYFLKKTMDELREVKDVAYNAKNKLSILENDHINKNKHLNEKFDALYEAVKDLTSEIKHLTRELNKKKDI